MWPHTTKANKIERSSFGAMSHSAAWPSHLHWNHRFSHRVPQIHEPGDSSRTSTGGALGIINTPFQPSMKDCHQHRSERVDSFSLIQWVLF